MGEGIEWYWRTRIDGRVDESEKTDNSASKCNICDRREALFTR